MGGFSHESVFPGFSLLGASWNPVLLITQGIPYSPDFFANYVILFSISPYLRFSLALFSPPFTISAAPVPLILGRPVCPRVDSCRLFSHSSSFNSVNVFDFLYTAGVLAPFS